MALSGIQIYKLLPGGERPPNPKANCKECGFPTCLAFAMKLAAKQAELASVPLCERRISNPIVRGRRASHPAGQGEQ